MADPTLKVKIQVDGQDAAAAGVKKVKAATDEFGESSKKLASEQGGLGSATRATTAAMSAFGAALSIAAIVKFSRDIATAKDEMAAMRQQAMMMSGSTQGFEALYASAQRLGVGLKDASQAVNFFAPALAKLGKSYEQSIEFSENLTKSMRVYGLEGQAASSVTTQLAQALSSGTLGGDELKSLRENAGGLAMKLEEAIQQVLGTTDSLKDLGTQGRLSSEVVSTAWDMVFKQLKGNIAGLPDTLAQQEARMGNAATLLMEALDKQLHVSDIWNWFESGLTEGMERAARSLNPPSLGANLDAVVRLNAEIAKAQAAIEKLRSGDSTPFRSSGIPGSYIGDKQVKDDGATKKAEESRLLQQINDLEKQRATYIELQATDSEVLYDYENRQLEQAKEKSRVASDTAAAEKAWSDSKISRAAVESAFGREAAATLDRMLPTISAMAEKYNLSEAAIIAMAKAESNFSQQARSDKGAVGVMQMTAAAAEQVAARTGLSFAQMRDGWKENIEGGAAYMRWLLDNSKGAIKNMDDLARAYNAGLGGMNKGFAETENHGNKVSASYEKLTIAGKSSTEMMTEATAAAKQQADAHAKAATEAERLAIAERQIDQIPADAQEKMDAYLSSQQEQLRVAGLTTEEKIRSAEASKIEAMALEEEHKAVQALVQGNTELADAHREAAERFREGSKAAEDNAVAISKMAATAKAAAPSVAELWNATVLEMSKSIQTSLTDAFTGLFDGTLKNASSFIDALKKVVIRGLANLASAILMNPINVVINATLVGASGSAQAGQTTVQSAYNDSGGGVSGLLGAGKYMTGGNSMTAGLAGYLGDAASKLGLASEGLLTAGSNLAMTSNLALGAGAVGGALLGNLVFKGEGYSEVGSSIGATAGAVIGSMILPGIGTVIGGLLGGLGGGGLGSLFGGEDTPTPETLYIQQKSGYFGTTKEINSNHETLQAVQEAEQALNDMLASLAGTLGQAPTDVFKNRSTVNQSLHPEDIGTWLTQQTQYTVGEMIAASTGPLRDVLWKAWEESGHNIETILPIAQEAKALLDSLPAISKEMQDAGMNLGGDAEKAAMQLLVLAGGIDNLTASQSAYADLFIGQEERMQNVASALGSEFEKLGMVLPSSRGELRRMVDALDLSVEANVKSRLAILGMSDSLDEYYLSMEDGKEATSDFTFEVDELAATLKDTAEELAKATDAYSTLFDSPEEETNRLSLELTKAFEALGFALPSSRDGLQSLVDAFDLTTAAGRLAYIGVMQFSAELDTLYNALGDAKNATDSYLAVVQQYYDLFATDEQKIADQIRWLADAFAVLGFVLPPTREAFKDLISTLSEEQRRALAENENILGKLDTYYDEQERLAAEYAAEQIRLAEEAQRAAEEAQRKAVENQKALLSSAHEARMDSIRSEQEAAQEALQKISGVVSSLKSAIASFRIDKDILDQSTFTASKNQLVSWAKGGTLPEQDALDKTLGGLSSFDKNSYATQADYARDYWATMSALTALEQRGLKQQTSAEKMVDSLQRQLDLENNWYQAEIERLDTLITVVGEAKIGAAAPVAGAETPAPGQADAAPSTVGQMAELITEVKAWREAQRMEAVDMATYQKRSADTLRKWDDEGMPDNREGTTYLRVA